MLKRIESRIGQMPVVSKVKEIFRRRQNLDLAENVETRTAGKYIGGAVFEAEGLVPRRLDIVHLNEGGESESTIFIIQRQSPEHYLEDEGMAYGIEGIYRLSRGDEKGLKISWASTEEAEWRGIHGSEAIRQCLENGNDPIVWLETETGDQLEKTYALKKNPGETLWGVLEMIRTNDANASGFKKFEKIKRR